MNTSVVLMTPHQPIDVIQSKVIDVSSLSAEQITKLTVSVAQYRAAQSRIGQDLYILMSQLVIMQEILGNDFKKFAEVELNLSPNRVKRYMHVYQVLESRFKGPDGRLDLMEANNISQNALLLLSDETPEIVIEEIRSIAGKGETVNEGTVRTLLERYSDDAKAEIAAAKARAERALREAEEAKERARNEVNDIQVKLQRNGEHLRRVDEERVALGEQIADLNRQLEEEKKKAVQVEEKRVEVEKIPEGFTSVQEAISSITAELKSKEEAKEAMDKKTEQLRQEVESLQDQAAALTKDLADFAELREQIDGLLTNCTKAYLTSLSSKNTKFKQALKGMGETLVELGERMKSATKE